MFTLNYKLVDCPFSVVIEDDGRVAYGYLLHNGEIIGDVWLYNCIEPKSPPDWNDFARMPFQNGRDFVNPLSQIRFQDQAAIAVQWVTDSEAGPHASILYQKELVAEIYPHSKPGRCRAAAKDGPLAKTLIR